MGAAGSRVEARTAPPGGLAGWPIVGWSTLTIGVLCGIVLLVLGSGEEGWRAIIRLTAKTSLTLFTAAFIASSARVLWPTPTTKWLLANRRYLGVSFAASHAIHLLGIIVLLRLSPDFQIAPATVIGGGLAYVFLAAMTATSFDRTAARLGPRKWKLLHRTGMYYCWFIFFISYAPRAAVESLLYLPFVIVLLGSIGVRIAARRARR
jgi:methionine sulfoxide reductase heme-binding subunit